MIFFFFHYSLLLCILLPTKKYDEWLTNSYTMYILNNYEIQVSSFDLKKNKREKRKNHVEIQPMDSLYVRSFFTKHDIVEVDLWRDIIKISTPTILHSRVSFTLEHSYIPAFAT